MTTDGRTAGLPDDLDDELLDWLTYWPNRSLTDWPTGWFVARFIVGWTELWIVCHSKWLTDAWTDWISVWLLIHSFGDSVNEVLTKWLIDWQSDVHCLTNVLSVGLIDGFIDSQTVNKGFFEFVINSFDLIVYNATDSMPFTFWCLVLIVCNWLSYLLHLL
jgi:hypothetical protein